MTAAQLEHIWVLPVFVFAFLLAIYWLLAKASQAGWPKGRLLASSLILGGLCGLAPRLIARLGVELFVADLVVPLVLFGLPLLSLTLPGSEIIPAISSHRYPGDRRTGVTLALGLVLGAWTAFIGSLVLLPALAPRGA